MKHGKPLLKKVISLLAQKGIRRKLLLGSLILCVSFLLIEYFISSHMMSSLLIREYYDQNLNVFQQAENHLNSIMEINEINIRRLGSSDDVLAALQKDYTKDNYKEIYDTLQFLDSRLGSIFQRSQYISGYTVIGRNDFAMSSTPKASGRYIGNGFSFDSFRALLEENQLLNTSGFTLFDIPSGTASQGEDDLLSTLNGSVVLIRDLLSSDDNLDGILLLTFDQSLFADVFTSEAFSSTLNSENISVSNYSGNILWSLPGSGNKTFSAPAAQETDNSNYTLRSTDTGENIQIRYPMDSYKLFFTNTYPTEKILQPYHNMKVWFLLFLLLIMIWIIPVSVYFSRKISLPLHTLSEKLKADLYTFTQNDFRDILLPDYSLFTKLLLFFLATVLLPNFIFVVLLTDTNYHIYKTEIEKYTAASIQQTKWNLDRILDNYSEISINLSYDQDIDSMIRQNDFYPLEKSFSDVRLSQSDFLAMNIIDLEGNSLFESNYYNVDMLLQSCPDLLEEISSSSGKLTFAGTQNVSPNTQVLIFSRPLYSLSKTRLEGYSIYLIDSEAFTSILKNISLGKNGYYFILDEDYNTIVYNNSSNLENVLQDNEGLKEALSGSPGSVRLTCSGQKSLAFFDRSDIAPFHVVGMVSLDELSGNVFRQLIYYILLFIVFLTIILGISFYISLSLTRPIKIMQKKMLQVSYGDFDVSMQYSGKDEIGILALYFNDMVSKIRKLISENYQAKIREKELLYLEKEAQLNALQQQINPHFLYNILESIKWMAYMNGAVEASNMATALGKFFKGAITKGQDVVTVRQETEHLNTYLYIQKLRYENRFETDIMISDEIMECRIIKLVLQPLVENAIVHGLENIKSGGLIRIHGERKDAWLHFQISDNGAGMDEEQLNALRSRFDIDEKPDPKKSVGIVNVYKRLYLYYEGHLEFNIDSKLTEGTCVEFCIPYEG